MSLTVATEKKKYTYQDYLQTPDEERYELINGELLVAPAPIPNHQRISRDVGYYILEFLKKTKLGEVFYAPCDVYLDEENTVQPDIFFISKERLNIIGEKKIEGAPDIAIEIVSSKSVYSDLVTKKKLYAKFGVKEYWIVMPKEKSIEVYVLKEDVFNLYKTFSEKDILESLIMKGFKLKLKDIF
ncbi:MAG: Uma2 family endonuclease [Cytophagales bacterium]|nr:Uma2 family endonuclease [Cytophagales bacterium]